MVRKRVTFSLWLMFSAIHLAVILVLFVVVVILEQYGDVIGWVAGTLLLLGTPFFAAGWAQWYVDRYNARIPSHYCRQCGYDLTGNITGRCPECGTVIPGKDESSAPSKTIERKS